MCTKQVLVHHLSTIVLERRKAGERKSHWVVRYLRQCNTHSAYQGRLNSINEAALVSSGLFWCLNLPCIQALAGTPTEPEADWHQLLLHFPIPLHWLKKMLLGNAECLELSNGRQLHLRLRVIMAYPDVVLPDRAETGQPP